MFPTETNKQKNSPENPNKRKFLNSKKTTVKALMLLMSPLNSLFIYLCLCFPNLVYHIKMRLQVFPLMFGLLRLLWLWKSMLMHLWLLFNKQMLTMDENVEFTAYIFNSSFCWQLLAILLWKGKEPFQAFSAFGSYRFFFFAASAWVITSNVPCHRAQN